MQQKLKKIKTNFFFFLELQLLISVTIMPILIAWGLPISIMTIAGNLVFAQFLTAFIFVSTLLFICEIWGIPHNYLVLLLESISHVWHYFLSFGSAHWLVGFASWMFPISSFCAIIACALYNMKISSQKHRIVILITLLSITPIIHKICEDRSTHTTVIHGSQKMFLAKKNNKIYAFDCGALGARPNSQSWIEYTLAPTLVKILGATHIDILFLCKSNSRTKNATWSLTEHIPTTKVVEVSRKKIKN
jgi:hypothetical protein